MLTLYLLKKTETVALQPDTETEMDEAEHEIFCSRGASLCSLKLLSDRLYVLSQGTFLVVVCSTNSCWQLLLAVSLKPKPQLQPPKPAPQAAARNQIGVGDSTHDSDEDEEDFEAG